MYDSLAVKDRHQYLLKLRAGARNREAYYLWASPSHFFCSETSTEQDLHTAVAKEAAIEVDYGNLGRTRVEY